jgi:hypothetical protein
MGNGTVVAVAREADGKIFACRSFYQERATWTRILPEIDLGNKQRRGRHHHRRRRRRRSRSRRRRRSCRRRGRDGTPYEIVDSEQTNESSTLK